MRRQTQGLPVDGLAGYTVEIYPVSLEPYLLPQLQMYMGTGSGYVEQTPEQNGQQKLFKNGKFDR